MDKDPSHPESEQEHGPAQPAAPGPARGAEDASAQALSEALRSSFNIVKFLMGVLIVAFILSGVFTVKPNQVAIKLRFGKAVGVGPEQLLKPGLHWNLPYPFTDIVSVPAGGGHTVVSTAAWYPRTPAGA